MLIEAKARDIVLTDVRDGRVLRRYLDTEERNIARPAKMLWDKQREFVTVDTVKRALQLGTIPDEWADPWNRMIREFVRDDIVPEWIKGISTAGDGIARKVNLIQRKQFDFDTTMTSVKAWIDSQGGTLIVELTKAQFNSVYAILQDQIALGVTSPYILAQRIRPIVGLTERETMAVARFMASLIEEGVPMATVNSQIGKYAKFLHKNRADRIARTELSNAYNFGQLDSLKQARDAGWLPGVPEKSWMAGGANPCEICEDNEAAGPIALDAVFPSGDEHPTAHPNCLVGDTRIIAPGTIGSYSAKYKGLLFRIITEIGNVTVTPNHYFLTPQGFAKASSLRKGDEILYSTLFERSAFGNPNKNGQPPRIDDVFTFLSEGINPSSIPMTIDYFHGDGAFMDGDVDVISTKSFLRDNRQSSRFKFIGNNSFIFSQANNIFFSRYRKLIPMLFSLASAADGIMGKREESDFFRIRDRFPHESSSLRQSSSNADFTQSSFNNRATYLKTFSNILFSFARQIKIYDILDIQIVSHNKPLDVYDLETSNSLYIMNGFLSSNCECSVSYKVRR